MSQLNVRINHKYDTYANWLASSLVLNKGEIAVAEIPTDTTGSGLTPPAIGIKIGDGAKTFAQLNWIQSTAGDVYAWAKKPNLEYSDLTEDFVNELKQLVSGEVQDTNTTYQFSLVGDVLTINHKEKTDDEFSKLIDITLPFSTKMDKDTDAVVGNLAKFDANGNAVDAGEKISDFIKTADADAKYAPIALEETVSGIDQRLGTAENTIKTQGEDITTLKDQIKGVTGAMHFEGVKDAIPTDLTGYESGDVIIVGEKEYVFNGTAFVEFGDVSAEGDRISKLEEIVGKPAAEGENSATGLVKDVEDLLENSHKHENLTELNKIADGDVAKWNTAAEAVGNAEAGLIKDVADLKTTVGDANSGIAKDVADLKTTVGDTESGLVKDVEDLLEADTKNIKTISGVEGTKTANNFEVTAVPVTLLKNVENDTLVFNCGTASTVI